MTEQYTPGSATDNAANALSIEPTADERQWGMLTHLSQLLGLSTPILSFVAPLVIWLVKKDASAHLDWHGKEVLNFQITMFIFFAVAAVAAFVTCGIGAFIFVPLAIYGLVMPIVAGIRANEGKRWKYPATFRFIS